MGYRYGIWLVVFNKMINDFIKKHNIVSYECKTIFSECKK